MWIRTQTSSKSILTASLRSIRAPATGTASSASPKNFVSSWSAMPAIWAPWASTRVQWTQKTTGSFPAIIISRMRRKLLIAARQVSLQGSMATVSMRSPSLQTVRHTCVPMGTEGTKLPSTVRRLPQCLIISSIRQTATPSSASRPNRRSTMNTTPIGGRISACPTAARRRSRFASALPTARSVRLQEILTPLWKTSSWALPMIPSASTMRSSLRRAGSMPSVRMARA